MPLKTLSLPIATPTPALSRLRELRQRPGIEAVDVDDRTITVSYELRMLGADEITQELTSRGLVGRLHRRDRLKLSLRRYRESIERDDMANEMGWDSFVREIYVSRYRHRRHGRRDDRPHHWRQYTEPPID